MRKGLSVIVGVAILLFAYSASAAVVTNGLVSWWKFDETSGTTAADSAGSNAGTVTGATWTTDTAGAASSGALYFDGDNDYVNCGSDSSLALDAFTLEWWGEYDATDNESWPLNRHKPGPPTHGYVVIAYNEDLYLRIGNGTDMNDQKSKTLTGSSNGWHQFAITYNTNKVAEWFMDGTSYGTDTFTYDIAHTNSDFYIGINPDGWAREITGGIDEVRVYNRALTASEVDQNYDAIPEPSTLLLLAGGLVGLLALKRRR